MAAALRHEDGNFGGLRELFGANFDALSAALENLGLSVCEAQGGYFLVADTGGEPDIDFVRRLARETGVVCTPMSVFYKTPFSAASPCTLVRFTICKSREHIQRACNALGLAARNRK